jgi:hypothetical protein
MYYEGTDKMSLRHLSCVTTTAGSTEGEYAIGINPDDLDPLISSHAHTLYAVASRASNRMDVKWALGTLHINTLDQHHACSRNFPIVPLVHACRGCRPPLAMKDLCYSASSLIF